MESPTNRNRGSVRDAYLSAADVACTALRNADVIAHWNDDSVLAGWSCGLLIAHIARSLLQVEWFLDAEEPSTAGIDAVTYYAALRDTDSPTSSLNVGVRQRSQETADLGATELARLTTASLLALRARLPDEPSDRRLTSFGRPMLLDQYLTTRTIELCVHLDDLAESTGIPIELPLTAIDIANETLVRVARRRHGGIAILRALTRSERDSCAALRVL